MDITLSISLLASDSRGSLERCLDSLKPILVKIRCELIIVLTGKDENVKRIAEQYTPHTIPFQWCQDFSAARNTGLKAARGEWFLYLDDDEWFGDTDEICEFFLSGEYRNYQSAHYIQRNYLDWYGTKHSDFSAFRMVKRLPETRFQNPIHEELTPRKEPCKYFQTCVHHYGYIKEAGDNKKASRNIPLLLQAIREEPSFVKNYLQLAKEYGLEGNWKSAGEYCRKGRDVCRNAGEPHSKGWLSAYLSYVLYENPGKPQAVSEIEGMLEKEHPSELIRLILYQQMICLYKENQDLEKAVQTGMKFEKLLDEMDRKRTLWDAQAYGEFHEGYVKNPERLYGGRVHCTSCALKLQDWKSALYFLQRFPWGEEDILCRYYPDFEKWLAEYGLRFRESLLQAYEAYETNESNESCAKAESSTVPAFIQMLRALEHLEKGRRREGERLYRQCMERAVYPFLRRILLREAIRNQISVSLLAEGMDLEEWGACAADAVKDFPFSLTGQVLESAEGLRKMYPFHSLILKKQALELQLLKGFYLWEELTAAFKEYCRCILDFYRMQYVEKMFTGKSASLLPGECRFAMAGLELLEKTAQGQTAEAVRLARRCIRLHPTATGMMNELIRQMVRREGDPAIHAGEEFHQLAVQMKGTLRILLEAGETAQAEGILNQLLPLMPEDTELIRMRQELIQKAWF